MHGGKKDARSYYNLIFVLGKSRLGLTASNFISQSQGQRQRFVLGIRLSIFEFIFVFVFKIYADFTYCKLIFVFPPWVGDCWLSVGTCCFFFLSANGCGYS